jgi:glycosyltransferase involved in cell wall biosynthesis
VTIIVPTRDRPTELEHTLAGVTAQLRDGDTLVVVDSASSDGRSVADVTSRYGAAPMRLDASGAGRARNAGWQQAMSELVVFVDDTVAVADGWLDALVAPFESDPRLGFVAGRIDPNGGPAGWPPVAVHSHPEPQAVLPGDPAPGDSASLAVRTVALRDVGGFDERLGPGTWFAAADDLDLLDRILLAGWSGRYEAAARATSPQPDRRREHVAKVWAYGKASGGRLSLLMRRDRRLAVNVARQVLPALRRRSGVPTGDTAGSRTPILAAVRAAGTVVGFVAGTVLLRRPAPAPTRAPTGSTR